MKYLSSMPNLYNFMRDGVSVENVLKRYALVCDQVVFNRFGAPIGGKGEFPSVGEFLAAIMYKQPNANRSRELGQNPQFAEIFVDMWDYVDDAERLEKLRYSFVDSDTSEALSEFAFAEVRRKQGLPADSYDFHIRDVKEIVGDLQSDFGLNEYARNEGLGTFASYSGIMGRALGSLPVYQNDGLIEIFDEPLIFPDLGTVSWDVVLELRTDRNIRKFRSFLEKSANYGEGANEVKKELARDLWKLVREVQPNVGSSVLSAVASNVPSPILVNPAGIALGIKDVAKARRLQKDFAHIFFIQNLQTQASQPSN